jgi:hypothetical protein
MVTCYIDLVLDRYRLIPGNKVSDLWFIAVRVHPVGAVTRVDDYIYIFKAFIRKHTMETMGI